MSERQGRPRTGSLYWTKSGWRARVTIDVDGVSVQKSFDLETTDKQVARIKLRRLVASLTQPQEQLATAAARAETFAEAAERIVAESAIGTDQGLKYLLVVDSKGMVERKSVKLGPLQDDGLRVIREGINEDDWVIVSGLQLVRPRMRVETERGAMPIQKAAD